METTSISTSPSKSKRQRPQVRLEEINEKLAEVRKKLADKHANNNLRIKIKKKEPPRGRRKSGQKTLHHPKLEFVLGEVVFSPYMTKPLDPYPQETFEVPKKLHELKKKLQSDPSAPKEELPYDVEFVRDRFLNEVANFSISFNSSAEEKSPLSTARSARSPFSRKQSQEESFYQDDSSLTMKSSIASNSSLPPVQLARRVPSSSGMRSNNLKSVSHDGFHDSQPASIFHSSSKDSSLRVKSLEVKGDLNSQRMQRLGVSPQKTVGKSIAVGTNRYPPKGKDGTKIHHHNPVSEPKLLVNLVKSNETAQVEQVDIKQNMISKEIDSLNPVPYSLSQADLYQLMTSFAMISHHMGR
jgi:hypothetical protein